MFDNPQQEVKNMSKKLRPVKLSDEAFELFYKEIYAEFGPKDVPPVELNPKKEEIPEEIREDIFEEVSAETQEETADFKDDVEESEADDAIQEEAAKAAALIRNIQEDEVIDDNTDGVKLTKPKKEKGIKGLVFTICLECLAIAGVIAYWLLYIL